MKAEVNNENKARFFALYYDQVVLFTSSFVKGEDLMKILSNHEIESYGKKAYLTLKPLSQISDEDEIQLMNLTGLVQVKFMINSLSIIGSRYVMNCIDASEAIDYLRSKGYALPWMGLSVDEMIEAGWIKLREEASNV